MDNLHDDSCLVTVTTQESAPNLSIKTTLFLCAFSAQNFQSAIHYIRGHILELPLRTA